MSCAWTYIYPYISGKVNHLFTGMHLGLKLQGRYPEGLHIICIPYQKLDEVVAALSEMERVPPLLRRDAQGKAASDAFDARLQAMEDINARLGCRNRPCRRPAGRSNKGGVLFFDDIREGNTRKKMVGNHTKY
jgi:hypothetical protein